MEVVETEENECHETNKENKQTVKTDKEVSESSQPQSDSINIEPLQPSNEPEPTPSDEEPRLKQIEEVMSRMTSKRINCHQKTWKLFETEDPD